MYTLSLCTLCSGFTVHPVTMYTVLRCIPCHYMHVHCVEVSLCTPCHYVHCVEVSLCIPCHYVHCVLVSLCT